MATTYSVIAKVYDSAAEHMDRQTLATGLEWRDAESMVERIDDVYPSGVYAIDEESGGVVCGRAS